MAVVAPLPELDTGSLPAPRRSRGASSAQRLLLDIAARAALPLVPATAIDLVHRGDHHFDRVLEVVARARQRVDVEMYQIRRDPIGWQLCSALSAAARRGVRVRLLADRFGCARVGDWLPMLAVDGVAMRWYRPFRPWRWPLARTHRKLVVVDAEVASIGGLNFAAEFSEQHVGARAWRDVGVWLRGPVVALLGQQFGWAWRRESAGDVAEPEIGSGGGVLDLGSGRVCALAGGLDGRTGNAETTFAMLHCARHEVLLATPYFIPEARLREALCQAARRGVRVVVAVPRLNDIACFKQASRFFYQRLLTAGVQVWERRDRMVHAKVAVVDGQVAAVGSMNLNRQSLHGNSETLLLTSSPRAVRDIHSLIEVEAAAASEAIAPPVWARRPDRRRLAELAAAPVSLVF